MGAVASYARFQIHLSFHHVWKSRAWIACCSCQVAPRAMRLRLVTSLGYSVSIERLALTASILGAPVAPVTHDLGGRCRGLAHLGGRNLDDECGAHDPGLS